MSFPWLRRHAWLLSVIVVLIVLAAIRLRVADVPLERDEGEYAYAGQLILQGVAPYRLAYNMKFPGTYYAYSAILAAFGQTPSGIRAGLLVINAATAVLLFFLARRLLHDAMGAAIAAAAFGILSVDRWIMGVFAHATHFVAFAAVAGLLVLFRAVDTARAGAFLAAGALLGLSVLMKQNGVFFAAFGIALAACYGRPPRRIAFRRAGLVAAGAALPLAVLFIALLADGVLAKFWFWTFEYASEYVSRTSPSQAWGMFLYGMAVVTLADKPLWILGLAGVPLAWMVRGANVERGWSTAFMAVSALAVCPGLYFREHYFLLLLPAVALFCGAAAVSIHRLLVRSTSELAARSLACAAFVLAAAWYVAQESDYLFAMPPQQLSRERYGLNPFVEAPEIARYIRARTQPQDTIAVLGSEPEIYFLANRRSATGYIYTYALMERQRYSARMQEEMMAEITAAHPKYLVFVAVPTSWLARNADEPILRWSDAYIELCYDRVGAADILESGTRYLWDEEVERYSRSSEFAVYTYRRKTEARCAVV